MYSYYELINYRQPMCTTYTLGSNAFLDVGKIARRKSITLPLTRNRELSTADIQYTKSFNTQ